MPSQNYLFPEDEPPTQHGLFEAPAGDTGTPPPPRRRLTKEEIDRVRDVPGFPIADDEAIIALSDPPHYTACPNPFLAEIVAGWREERAALRARLGLPDDEADPAAYNREPFAADVSEGKNDPIYNAHSYHTKVPHKAIMRYILHYTDPGDIVFDGFCGTGMTGVAAQLCSDRAAVESLGYRVDGEGVIYDGPTAISRLGARKAVLNDLAPAATFIAYNYNAPVDAAAFEAEARHILREVEAECSWMYETTHTDGRKGRINYIVWSDMIACPNCASQMMYWDVAVDFSKSKMLDNYQCPSCKASLSEAGAARVSEKYFDDLLQTQTERIRRSPALINYSVGSQRFTKKPDQADFQLIDKIESFALPPNIPVVPMMHTEGPWGQMWRAGYHFGVTHVHHFFARRSLVILGLIWNRINNAPVSLQDALRFAFTGTLQIASRMSRFRFDSRKEGNTAGGIMNGALFIPALQKEAVVWELFERRLAAVQRMFSSFSRSKKHSSMAISTGSATKTNIPVNSLDYVFTDPPFGANIIYSELSFLWEAWLKVYTQVEAEAIVNVYRRRDIFDYQRIMQGSFENYYRALKSGHWITVEFHNSQNSIWNSIQEALTQAGFVVADVRTLDKQQGSFKQVTSSAVKQDLVISAYKPRAGFERRFEAVKGTEDGAWAFVREHLAAVPVFVAPKGRAEIIAERLPYLLFDRMVAFHLQRGATVPLSAAQFYAGLKQRFPERDGMYFLETQAAEYDQKRAAVGTVEQFTFYVSDEKSSIQWLRQLLTAEGPMSYQQIQPRFLQELQQSRTELLPELRDLLQASFIQDVQGRWQVADPANELHLEQLRRKELLREYETYKQGKGKLKSVRSEAVRAGFDEAYKRGDYAAILAVAARLPEAVLREDPTILTYYDLAQMEEEG